MDKDHKQVIKESAYNLFSQYGYKQTSVAKIMRDTKLAIGTFYNYYPSKEELFLDVYIDENNQLREKLMQEIHWDDEIDLVLTQAYNLIFHELANNKILSEWTQPTISEMLKDYYLSDAGKKSYPFSAYLQTTITDKLNKLNIDAPAIEEIIQGFELIFRMESAIHPDNYFTEINQLQTVLKYFVLGIKSYGKE